MSFKIKNTTGQIDSPLKGRVDRHENIIYAVVLVLIFMLAQLLIDSFRFSTVTYKEYSNKVESVETTQKVNQELLDQNAKNQELIIQLEKHILNIKK